MSTTILAIDLGKCNSVLCWYEPQSRNGRFGTVKWGAALSDPHSTIRIPHF